MNANISRLQDEWGYPTFTITIATERGPVSGKAYLSLPTDPWDVPSNRQIEPVATLVPDPECPSKLGAFLGAFDEIRSKLAAKARRLSEGESATVATHARTGERKVVRGSTTRVYKQPTRVRGVRDEYVALLNAMGVV